MNKAILVGFLLFCPALINAQVIRLSVAPTANYAPHYTFVTGGPGERIKQGISTSLEVLLPGKKKINFGAGVTYQYSQVGFSPNLNTGERIPRAEKVSLLSLSIKCVYNFKPGYYISMDPCYDFHLNYLSDQILDNQTGLGFSLGFGKNITVSETLSLNIEPRVWIHNIIKLDSESYPYRLTTLGLNLALLIGK